MTKRTEKGKRERQKERRERKMTPERAFGEYQVLDA